MVRPENLNKMLSRNDRAKQTRLLKRRAPFLFVHTRNHLASGRRNYQQPISKRLSALCAVALGATHNNVAPVMRAAFAQRVHVIHYLRAVIEWHAAVQTVASLSLDGRNVGLTKRAAH
jgi:hypothetical protein